MIAISQLLCFILIPCGLRAILLGRVAFFQPSTPFVLELVALAEADDRLNTELLDHNINALSAILQVVRGMVDLFTHIYFFLKCLQTFAKSPACVKV